MSNCRSRAQQLTASSTGTGELIGTMQGRDNVLGGFDAKPEHADVEPDFSVQPDLRLGAGDRRIHFGHVRERRQRPDRRAEPGRAAFTPQNGTFQVEVTNQITGQTTTSTINVNLNGTGNDTTLDSLASELNGVANVSASVTPDGHLQINAASNYQIQFANDSSNTLAVAGDQHVLYRNQCDQHRRQFGR